MEATGGEGRTSPAVLAEGSFCSSSSIEGLVFIVWLSSLGVFFFVCFFLFFFLFPYSLGPERVVCLACSSKAKRWSGCTAWEPVLSRVQLVNIAGQWHLATRNTVRCSRRLPSRSARLKLSWTYSVCRRILVLLLGCVSSVSGLMC